MSYTKEDFKLYQLPYRHSIQSFNRFNEKGRINYLENDYYTYLISTPYKKNTSKTKHNYGVEVAIVVRNKKTKQTSIELEKFDFKSLLTLNMGQKIDESGQSIPIESSIERANKFFDILDIKIQDTLDFEMLTLKDVVESYGLYSLGNLYKYERFSNLEFYLYKIDGVKYLIPSMEILKYFYLSSWQKNLNSHFCRDILTPNGILNGLNSYDFKEDYVSFEIKGSYSLKDAYKMMFFFSYKSRLEKYSSVYDTYKRHNKIRAMIPKKNVDLKVRVLSSGKDNLKLVLNILKHDNEEEIPSNIQFEYTHAKSRPRESKTGKRDQSKDVKKKQYKNENIKFDDSKFGDRESGYSKKTKKNINKSIDFTPYLTVSSINRYKSPKKQKEERGGKVHAFKKDEELPITSKENLGNDGKAVSIEKIDDNSEKKETKRISFDMVVKYLQKDDKYELLERKSDPYPKVHDDLGNEKNIWMMFVDKEKKIRRNYSIARFQNKDKEFYIVELEPRFDGQTKTLLVIFKNKENIKSIYEKYLIDELVEIVNSENKRWFTGSIAIDKSNYTNINHSKTLETFMKRIKARFKD